MKKIFLLIFSLFLLAGCSMNQTDNIEIKENAEPSNQDLLDIIMLNSDAIEYFQANSDAKIVLVEKFLPLQKLNETDFVNEYNKLENREYYEVTIRGSSQLSLIAIVDLENKLVTGAYGIFLVSISS